MKLVALGGAVGVKRRKDFGLQDLALLHEIVECGRYERRKALINTIVPQVHTRRQISWSTGWAGVRLVAFAPPANGVSPSGLVRLCAGSSDACTTPPSPHADRRPRSAKARNRG